MTSEPERIHRHQHNIRTRANSSSAPSSPAAAYPPAQIRPTKFRQPAVPIWPLRPARCDKHTTPQPCKRLSIPCLPAHLSAEATVLDHGSAEGVWTLPFARVKRGFIGVSPFSIGPPVRQGEDGWSFTYLLEGWAGLGPPILVLALFFLCSFLVQIHTYIPWPMSPAGRTQVTG